MDRILTINEQEWQATTTNANDATAAAIAAAVEKKINF